MRSRTSRGRACRAGAACDRQGRDRDRRHRRALRRQHQPARQLRPGAHARGPRRRGSRRHGVRPVPSDRARRRAPSDAARQRGGARRGRDPHRRRRRAVHGRDSRRRARAARRRRARDPASALAAGASSSTPARRSARAFRRAFPVIAAACRAAGVDPAREPIPVRPAQHYHMGGIAVDAEGRSSVAGLWACGEAACTGLHGANRLASNSLTEAAVVRRDRRASRSRARRRAAVAPARRACAPGRPIPPRSGRSCRARPASCATEKRFEHGAAPLCRHGGLGRTCRRSRRRRGHDRRRGAETRAQRRRP